MKRLFIYGVYLLFCALLVFVSYHAQSMAVDGEYFFIFLLIFVFVMLPVIDHICFSAQKYIGSSITPDAYVDTIDSIIQLNSIDELLSTQFNQILRLLGLEEGKMIFYDRERDEYTVYLKTVEPDRFIKTGTLDYDNVLIKILYSPEDIIIKSRLTGELTLERNLISMMDSMNAEIIIPMYFSETLTGAMMLGKRPLPYTPEEISALKIFASKIASLSINSMFWKELARKRELEKERKMELRVQRSFLPEENLTTGSCEVSVFFNMNAVLSDRFHTLFSHNGHMYFISYRTMPEDRSALIFLPPLAVLSETYICSGYTAADSIEKAKRAIMELKMFDSPPQIFACSIAPGGRLDLVNETDIEPFLFTGTSLMYPAEPGTLSDNDMCIYTNTHIKHVFLEYSVEIGEILSKSLHLPVDDIKKKIVAFLESIHIIREKSFFSLFLYRKK